MTFRSLITILLLALLVIPASARQESVTLNYRVVNNIPVKFVAVDMNDPEVLVTTAVAPAFPFGLDSWGNFIKRLRPAAAINGTYFCTRTAQPVGDIAMQGSLIYRGCVGTALCITPQNRASLQPGPLQAHSTWSGYSTVLCAGPRVLANGHLTMNAHAEGFRDPHVLGPAPRSAIALRADGVLLLLTIEKNISLTELGGVCKHLGAVHAMALDGGSSSGLYAKGKTVTAPGRRISNVIAVYATRTPVDTAALIPTPVTVLANLLKPLSMTTMASASTTTDTANALEPEEDLFGMSSYLPMLTPPPQPPLLIPSLIRIMEPQPDQMVKGLSTIKIHLAPDDRIAWCSLRINGQLCATSDSTSLQYAWDSTKEPNGTANLEVSVWSHDKSLLTLESRQIIVQNQVRVAEK